MVHPDNSPAFYEFNNLYPQKTKTKDPDFIVVEPEEPMNNFIEISDEPLLENEYNIKIPKTTTQAPITTTQAPTSTTTTQAHPIDFTQSIIPKENKESLINFFDMKPLSSLKPKTEYKIENTKKVFAKNVHFCIFLHSCR